MEGAVHLELHLLLLLQLLQLLQHVGRQCHGRPGRHACQHPLEVQLLLMLLRGHRPADAAATHAAASLGAPVLRLKHPQQSTHV